MRLLQEDHLQLLYKFLKRDEKLETYVLNKRVRKLQPPDSNTNAKTSTVVLGNVSSIMAPSKDLCNCDEISLLSDDA